MSTLTEIEAAIEQLPPGDRLKLARWMEERIDPDQGLELREEIVGEMTAAREEIARGDVSDWADLKRRAKPAAR